MNICVIPSLSKRFYGTSTACVTMRLLVCINVHGVVSLGHYFFCKRMLIDCLPSLYGLGILNVRFTSYNINLTFE